MIENNANNRMSEYIRERNSLVEEVSKKDEEIERLKKRLKNQKEKTRRYKDELVNISVLDRWKIGQYFHDHLTQKLVYIKILARYMREKLDSTEGGLTVDIDKILQVLDEVAKEVRDLSHDIIPVNIVRDDVAETFSYLIENIEAQHNITCTLEADGWLEKIKCKNAATNLYHITQEAIKNAVIHGEAMNIKISVIQHNDNLHFHIKDDGKGFSYSDKTTGMGITIMKHRAEEMGGTFSIRTAEDNEYTTCVVCVLPIEKLLNH